MGLHFADQSLSKGKLMKDRITDTLAHATGGLGGGNFAETHALEDALERCPALHQALQFSHDAFFRPNVPYEMLCGLIFPTAQLPGLFPPDASEYGVLLKLPLAMQGQLQALATSTPYPVNPSVPAQPDNLPHARWQVPGTTVCIPLQALADVVDLCAPYSMRQRCRPTARIPVAMVAGEHIALSTFTQPLWWDDRLQELGMQDWDPNDPGASTQDRMKRLLRHGKRYSFIPWCIPAACYSRTSMAHWPTPWLWLPMTTWFAGVKAV